jgi:hypothetical protein
MAGDFSKQAAKMKFKTSKGVNQVERLTKIMSAI